MTEKNAPIGVFDSGLGGISVLRVLQKELPTENFLFFGDQKNAPYGERSIEKIRELSENALRFLLHKSVKAVVIACNTATSAAADYLREKYPDLIIVGMEPAVKPAALSLKKPEVLVLATPATIKGERLHHLLQQFEQQANYHLLPAPGIVGFVESGKEHPEEFQKYLGEILAPYQLSVKKQKETNTEKESKEEKPEPAEAHSQETSKAGIASEERRSNSESFYHLDSVVLGCTHFPFVKKEIQEALGYPVQFFDGTEGTARETRHRLDTAGLLTDRSIPGSIMLYSSSGHTELMESLLKMPMSDK